MSCEVKLIIVAFDKDPKKNQIGVFRSDVNNSDEITLFPSGAGGWMVEGDEMLINGTYYILGKSIPIKDGDVIEINMEVYYSGRQ